MTDATDVCDYETAASYEVGPRLRKTPLRKVRTRMRIHDADDLRDQCEKDTSDRY